MSGKAAQLLTTEATNDAAELRAMLANHLKAHDALIAEHAKMKKLFSAEAKKVRDRDARINKLESEKEALQADIDDWESGEVVRRADRDIEDLARIRALLKRGEAERARDGLERLLDGLDTCWRNRAATIVGQGAML